MSRCGPIHRVPSGSPSQVREAAEHHQGVRWPPPVKRHHWAAFANASLGVDGASFTTETFSTASWQIASTFGSAAASGLTVAKMIEAKRIFRKAQVDMEAESITWVTNSQGESDLLNQVQVVSTEFSDK